MIAFNFFETTLLCSLAITLTLTIFLIYHFKQRLITVEEKNDTMFDIINNMAQELTNVRQTLTYVTNQNSNQNVNDEPIQIHFDKVNVSDDEESGDEESGDEESGDEESGNEESGDEESGDEESGDEESDMDDSIDDSIDDSQTKQILLPVDQTIDTNVTSDENDDNNPIDESEVTTVELNDDIEPLIVEKINSDEQSLDENSTNNHYYNYRKMNVQQLKDLVEARNISEDISKMKKADIITLLKNNA